jgi:hypothetical protein
MTAGDPLHPGIIFGGTGARWDLELNAGAPLGQPTGQQSPEPPRTDWTQPLVFSKADPHALYYANQYLFKTSDDGKTWAPDQPGHDASQIPGFHLIWTKSPLRIRTGMAIRGVIYTVAPSPVRPPVVWIGTDDGLIHVTTDDGKTWQKRPHHRPSRHGVG